MNIKKDIFWRVMISATVVALVAVLVVAQLVQIQLVQSSHWKDLSKKYTLKYVETPAFRGSIFASDGSLLATSIPRFELRWDLKIPKQDSFDRYVYDLARRMHGYFDNGSVEQYHQYFLKAKKSGNRYLLIGRHLNYLDLKELKSWPIFRDGQYRGGFIVLKETIRVKPFGGLAQRTIGYVNEEGIGVGLERYYNELLSGDSGKRLCRKIAGAYMPVNEESEISPIDGMDLYTTIDVNLQDVSEKALERAILQHRAKNGCAILMDVTTGEIRSIVNLKREGDQVYEDFNYSVGSSIEPGSTFKLVSTLALLEEEAIGLEDSVEINYGTYDFYDSKMKDSETGTHKSLTFQDVFAKSSNVGISRMVFEEFKDQPKEFLNYLAQLKLYQPIGIQIFGEGKPNIKDPSQANWSGTTLPWMSIGYELQLTPLQMLTVYAAVANGGAMLKPTLVAGFGEAGKITRSKKPEVRVDKIASDQTLEQLRYLLRRVVTDGTARNLKNLKINVAGKTGTSLIAFKDRGYKDKRYNASFAGFFPYENPKYACIVVISQPSTGVYYGSSVAAPVFGEIASAVYAKEYQKTITPDSIKHLPLLAGIDGENLAMIQEEIGIEFTKNDLSAAHIYLCQGHDKLLAVENESEKMPDVRGLGLRKALVLLEQKGLQVHYRGYGVVKNQAPGPGKIVKSGNDVYIALSP